MLAGADCSGVTASWTGLKHETMNGVASTCKVRGERLIDSNTQSVLVRLDLIPRLSWSTIRLSLTFGWFFCRQLAALVPISGKFLALQSKPLVYAGIYTPMAGPYCSPCPSSTIKGSLNLGRKGICWGVAVCGSAERALHTHSCACTAVW